MNHARLWTFVCKQLSSSVSVSTEHAEIYEYVYQKLPGYLLYNIVSMQKISADDLPGNFFG